MSNYYRNMQVLKIAQAAYDNRLPPEFWDDDEDETEDNDKECPDCGAEIIQCGDGWACNETCGWHSAPLITADDLAEAADELETERLEEIIKGGDK